MLCGLGFHRVDAKAVWNGGCGFSVCSRCGCEMVRKPGAGWAPVPRGYAVVWRPVPSPSTMAEGDYRDWSKPGSWVSDAPPRETVVVSALGVADMARPQAGDAPWLTTDASTPVPPAPEPGSAPSIHMPTENMPPFTTAAASPPRSRESRRRSAETGGIFHRFRDWISDRTDRLTPPREPASRGFRYLARQIGALRQANEPASTILLSAVCDADTANDAMMMFAAMLQDELGGRLLIIDATLRGDGISNALGVTGKTGLSEVRADDPDALLEMVQSLSRASIFLLSAGQRPAAARPMELASLMPLLTCRFDHILIQQHAIIADTRYLPIAATADLVLVLAEEGASRMRDLTRCQKAFEANGIDRVGLLLSEPAPRADHADAV